jgi:hypothetical protein
MSKHINIDDEDHHSHTSHHSHQDDDLHPFPLPSSITSSSPMSSSSSTPEKDDKSFAEQLMMSSLNYLPAFIQPEHHIVDGMIPSPDHSNLLHPVLSQNESFFSHTSHTRQDNRAFNKGTLREVDEVQLVPNGNTNIVTEQRVVQSLQGNLFHASLGGLSMFICYEYIHSVT